LEASDQAERERCHISAASYFALKNSPGR
jgi:hypothetical protein